MVILRFITKLFLISFIYSDSQHNVKGLWIVRDHMVNAQLIDDVVGFAKENGFKRLELSTAKDNHIGQSLYESLGYELDQEFLHYSLEVD